MTEKEVLEKLDFFKQAIQKLKEELDFWKEQSLENPKEVCETEGWIEAYNILNEERFKDAETIAELRRKCEDFSNDFTDADLECDRLKTELEKKEKQEEILSKRILELQKTEGTLTDLIDKADNAYAALARKYHEDVNPEKKYTEEDLKNLLHRASEISKKKINDLTNQNKSWEEEYYKLKELYDNLEITNRGLEREVQEKHAEEDIDKILEGQMSEKEMDEILTKPTKTVKLEV